MKNKELNIDELRKEFDGRIKDLSEEQILIAIAEMHEDIKIYLL